MTFGPAVVMLNPQVDVTAVDYDRASIDFARSHFAGERVTYAPAVWSCWSKQSELVRIKLSSQTIGFMADGLLQVTLLGRPQGVGHIKSA